jgi:predicted nucleic acid-binding protein
MYLLDTNVVSELRKVRSGRADPAVAAWADAVEADALFLSAITLHEIELGVLRVERRDQRQGTVLRGWMEQALLPTFAERILPVDAAVARRSATLHLPDPRPLADAFIAATALVHGMTMVTRDVADFRSFGVDLVNPWGEPIGQ